jgi:hypothetical protein
MNAKKHILVCAVIVAILGSAAIGAGATDPIEIAQHEGERSTAHLEAARLDGRAGLAVVFTGTDDLHYYAKSESAPAPGFNLKVAARAPGVAFAEPVFPKWKPFYDPGQEKEIEVYVGDFTVFVPFETLPRQRVEVTVELTGLACTSQLCLPPFTKELTATIDPAGADSWRTLAMETSEPPAHSATTSAIATGETPSDTDAARQAVLPYSTGV